ncbi:hypothetical protein [Caballeronia sp. dw_19]|uniref:hypothetical protein n=1 Tax=Caballeronia sp. dw_19 TaxID=2719791 RepID=UPI001BD2F5F3|nr:hypothetical protein [Caballeronia sp. dw_19]
MHIVIRSLHADGVEPRRAMRWRNPKLFDEPVIRARTGIGIGANRQWTVVES